MSDTVLPEGRWAFDEQVTDVFSNMLDRSIPQIEVMRELVADLARRHVVDGTTVLDLGTSRGDALASLRPSARPRNHFVGIECSPPMLDAARQRFDGYGNVTVLNYDLRDGLPDTAGIVPDVSPDLSVCLSVLTAMFVPIEHRARLIRAVYDQLAPGGVLLLVEKVLGGSSPVDDLFVDVYLARKRERGYTEEQIARKKLALEGVLVPVTAEWNEQMLARAGFAAAECFWRWCNFAGWIAVKR